MRVAIPDAKGNRAFLAHVQEELSRCPQVSSATANPLTGTVLIKHSGDHHQVSRFAEKHALFRLGGEEKRNGLEEMTVTAWQSADAAVRKLTAGEMDLKRAAFAALLGTGTFQILRGRFQAPPWHTAFWYAFMLLTERQKAGKRAAKVL
jgi:hypothetical protein